MPVMPQVALYNMSKFNIPQYHLISGKGFRDTLYWGDERLREVKVLFEGHTASRWRVTEYATPSMPLQHKDYWSLLLNATEKTQVQEKVSAFSLVA